MRMSAFGVQDGRISKADGRRGSITGATAAGAGVGTVAGAAGAAHTLYWGRLTHQQAEGQVALLEHMKKYPNSTADGKRSFEHSTHHSQRLFREAKVLRHAGLVGIGAGAAVGAGLVGSTRAIQNRRARANQ